MNRFSLQPLCCLAAVLLATPPIACARETDFPKGTKEWSLTSGFTQERTGEPVYLANVTVGRSTFFRRNAAFGVQVPFYFAHDKEEAAGVGVQAVARYHFLNINRFSLYGDILGGALYTTTDFPTGGTELNFTYAGGPGVSFRVAPATHLVVGYRFQHVSNGFIKGRDRNPILNSLGAYLGVNWTF